jgi:hypothetical protein
MPAIRQRIVLAALLVVAATASAPSEAQEMGPLPGPPVMTTPPNGCMCGERHGLGRWWWHRMHCKRHLQEHFLGYPEEFNEWPLGASLYAHGRTQVANGKEAQMVFYDYDFIGGTTRLNDRGRDKLARIAAELPTGFSPVIVERTTRTPGLDQGRRLALLSEFNRGSFPVPAERVVVAAPLPNGLQGQESNVMYANQLQSLQNGPYPVGGGTGSGLDAGGLSGGAVSGVR